jgi:hypothetical protein
MPIIHVGLHKTASTWLQERYFPLVGGMANGHPRPLRDPILRSLITGEGTPPPLEDKAILSSERLSGHPSNGWLDADIIADRIAAAYPNAKIVVGTRDLETWKRSLYHQLIREGETRPMDVLLQPRWRGTFLNFDQVSLEALRNRYRRFPELLILPMEQLKDDPQDYVARLSEFIGIPVPEGLDFSPHYQDRMRRPELYRRANRFIRSDLNPSPAIPARPIARFFQKVLAQQS